MNDKNDKNKKLNEQEVQAWMDSVHFGSCCSDSLDNESLKQEPCSISDKEKKTTK